MFTGECAARRRRGREITRHALVSVTLCGNVFYNPDVPILNPNAIEFTSRSPEQTRRVGMRLGALLKPGDLICLSGELGSGKTTLVQGMAQGWGSLDHASSPTFVLVNEYRRPDGGVLHHMDAYRLQDAGQAQLLDLDAMLENGALVIEWAERIKDALPAQRVDAELRWSDDERRGMTFTAEGKRAKQLMAEFRQRVFGV